jgi:general stress protein YciG
MKSRRGLASMTPERRREIAVLGGNASHAKGKAHQFTPEEAQIAGRKGSQRRWALAAEAKKPSKSTE